MRRIALLAALALPSAAGAQFVSRPHLDWRTAHTPNFHVHYPAEYAEWARAVAGRLEAARTEVERIVGFAPSARVQVLIDDPVNAPNGFALPFLDRPTMAFFPVPPTPRQTIGDSRDWGELLAVHEFAHLAHLTRPSRNPRDRLLWQLLPVRLGPVARRSPRWVTEGFATYVEGRVTGSGRPHNTWRPAILRQWALEGRMPTYSGLSAVGGYQGGAFAYLAGSAYLEWLARREGDSTIAHLWRRMSARTTRDFPAAFAGVYGRDPNALYGRFVAELTGDALEMERRIDSLGGVREGELVQRLAWETGDPAVSPDGSRVAVVLRSATRPGRVVVWPAGEDSLSRRAQAARDSARARALRRDPQDVPDRDFSPPPRRVLAMLEPKSGRAYDAPRFLRDGRHVLVARAEPIGGGAFRPDLFVWDTKSGRVRRVTRGAGVRQGDPFPDGRTAAAVRCARGWCDLVQVDLATGAVATLRSGSPSESYYRPRVSPSGDRIAVAVQHGGTWQLALVDAAAPDRIDFAVPGAGVNRYDVSWAGDSMLLATSDRAGIANIERVDLRTGRVDAITRVTGAALAPEMDRAGGVWLLSLHASGLDVRRIAPAAPGLRLPAPDTALFPAVPVPPVIPPAAIASQPVVDRAYGLGPRATRWLPGLTRDAGATAGQLLLINGDPVGRLELALLGSFGGPAAWRGARAWATVRRWRPAFTADLFAATQRALLTSDAPDAALDVELSGGALRAHGGIERTAWRAGMDAGASAARVGGGATSASAGARDGRTRATAFAAVDASGSRRVMLASFAASVRVLGDAGRHGSANVRHMVATASVAADAPMLPVLQLSVTHARSGGDAATAFERIGVGGAPSVLLDAALLPQRIAMPALPAMALVGDAATIARGELRLGAVAPYVWTARIAGDAYPGWQRVVGAEARFSSAAIPIVTLPRVDLAGGVGHSIDAPYRRRTTMYASITYRP